MIMSTVLVLDRFCPEGFSFSQGFELEVTVENLLR